MEETPPQTANPTFSNDHVHVTVHRKPFCLIELEVKASADLAREAHKKAVKAVSKEVVLSGFRKGKAPEEFVAKKFPGEVNTQWQQSLADASFIEAEKLIAIPPLSRETKINFNVKNHSLEGATVFFSFEINPQVPSVDPKQFLPEPPKKPEVNEQKTQETIRQLQLFFAEWKPISGRPAQEGDFVILDVDVIEETPPQKLFSNTRFEVTLRSMAKWMYDLVLGQPAGATLEGVSMPDENLSEEEKKAFPPKKVRLHIKTIEEALAPPVDDAFAARVGVHTVQDLHTNVTTLLHRLADEHVQEKLREAASDFLLNHYPFELPKSLIEKETHFRMRQLLSDSAFQSHWNTLSTEDRKKLVDSIYQQSQKAVRMFYLCRKILEDAHIAVSAEDLKKTQPTPLEVLLKPQTEYFAHPQTEMQQAEAYSRILLEKAEDYVITNRTIA